MERAVTRRHLLAAETAAREMGRPSLADALAFTVLLAEQEPDRFERAAVRWHGRWEVEAPADLRLRESELMLAALAALTTPARDPALRTLLELGRMSGLSTLESALRPLL